MKTKEQFKEILNEISYKDWILYLGEDGDRLYLQIQFYGYDTRDIKMEKEKTLQTCRKWVLSPHMTTTEVVQTAWHAICRAEMHEIQERFLYRGSDIFNSHINVDRLVDLCSTYGEELYDIRK